MIQRPRHSMLVVDDEEGPRASIRMVFKNEFDVHTFDDGDAAIDFARSNPVNIAILDIRMAGKSGIEVLQALKEVDPHIEVIMLTAYETLDTAKQALRLGACDYLNKPFDLPTIRDAVARAMHLRTISENVATNTERLQSLTDQLHDAFSREEMTRTANEIYAGVIHDINNPLTIIAGFVDLLQRRLAAANAVTGQDLEGVRENLRTISKQVNTCCAIAARYLKFMSRLGKERQLVSVNQVLTDLDQLLRNHPALHNSVLVVEPLEQDAFASIHGTDLIQILLNLAVNALQSTPAPQTIRVTATLHPQSLPVAAFASGPDDLYTGLETFANTPPLIALAVADQGSGIPSHVLPRIFEAYFTTKEAGKGTGLGLSIVARLIKAGRGHIHVHTQLGVGTTMTVVLPAQLAAPSVPAEAAGSGAADSATIPAV